MAFEPRPSAEDLMKLLFTPPFVIIPPMSPEEARDWIDQVDGVVYHNDESEEAQSAWVAVVRTPGMAGRKGKVILAFGESLEEATGAAEAEWDEIWEELSAVH